MDGIAITHQTRWALLRTQKDIFPFPVFSLIIILLLKPEPVTVAGNSQGCCGAVF